MRRVVVTGLGVVSPLGSGVDTAWARLLAGRSGLRGLPDWAASLPAKIAGIVPDKEEDPEGGFDPYLAVPRQRPAQNGPLHSVRARCGSGGHRPGGVGAGRCSGARTHSHRHCVGHRRLSGHRGLCPYDRSARRAPLVAVHDPVLPRQPRGWPYLHPSWLQGADRYAGHGLCRRCAGHR